MEKTTKKFNLMQLFSIVDGRLSNAGMKGVHDVLGHVFNRPDIQTIELPGAADKLRGNKPQWWYQVEGAIEHAQEQVGNEFPALMKYIEGNNLERDIPQI